MNSSEPLPATEWSLVDLARQRTDHPAAREALAVLLKRYLPALRSHLVSDRRIDPERAEDLLQGFVADKIIEQKLLDHAARERGKFRSFLLATLDHYVISAHRLASAAKRRPETGLAALADNADRLEAGGNDDPARAFDVAWARELIAEAIARMRAECDRSGRPDVWRIFQARVLVPAMEGGEPVAYEHLVRELGLEAPLIACSLLATAKRMFARNLRAVAGEYADTSGAADAEISELREILAAGAKSSLRPRS
jgi:RNA polymerase sigma-70 factor (ECF subfamily)